MEVSGGSIDDVLTDDNLADILVRLDAVSVLRCRAVCKIWRRVATDRSFLTAHAAARPREMIIETKYGYARSTVPLPTPDDDIDDTTTLTVSDDGDHAHHRYLVYSGPTPADREGMSSVFSLYASLDGLLVLKQWRSGPPIISYPFTYVICNPVTRQWANLPSPVLPCHSSCDFRSADACGFYLHASSGKYRLLLDCVVRDFLPWGSDWERYSCVLSVGSTLPRRLSHAPPTKKLVAHYDDPVFYHGTLHWLSGQLEGSSTGKMLAFDTASETFRLMPRPPEGPEPMTEATSNLLELGGELSVATIYQNGNETTLDIWALQDYEAEEWTLRHRLKVQQPPRWSGDSWKPLITMAMGNPPRGSSTILVDFGGFVSSLMVFSESLVPHAFLDSPDTVPLNFSNPLFNEIMQGHKRLAVSI